MSGDAERLTSPPATADLVIVGGGVVGAATAFFAARAGLRPVLLEARPALCTLTTPASTGAYRLQFDNVEELRLVRESVELFHNFPDVTGQKRFDLALRRQGYLWVTTDEKRASWQRDLVGRQHAWGQSDIEVLDHDQVRRAFPHVTELVVQGRWRAGDGFLDPKALTLGLVEGSAATVVTACPVTGFDVNNGALVRVRTARGTVSTDRAVIACGPLSGLVAELAGIELPVHTVNRHKVVFPDLPVVPRTAPMTIDDDTGAHWRPALNGAFALYTDPATEPTAPTEAVPPDPGLAFTLLDPSSPVALARVTPFWNDVWSNGATWLMQSGQYTMTPDRRPLLGETDVHGLFVNTGYSGHGIMGAPAGSRHLVDVMTGAISRDANVFALQRRFEGREHDLL